MTDLLLRTHQANSTPECAPFPDAKAAVSIACTLDSLLETLQHKRQRARFATQKACTSCAQYSIAENLPEAAPVLWSCHCWHAAHIKAYKHRIGDRANMRRQRVQEKVDE